MKGQNVNVCPDDIFLTTKHFVSKLGLIVHCHKPVFYGEFWIVQGQGQKQNFKMSFSVYPDDIF